MDKKEIMCYMRCKDMNDQPVCCYQCERRDICTNSIKCNDKCIKCEDIEEEIAKKQAATNHNKINKLLDIEVILRDMSSREELVMSMISDKALAIYNKLNNEE